MRSSAILVDIVLASGLLLFPPHFCLAWGQEAPPHLNHTIVSETCPGEGIAVTVHAVGDGTTRRSAIVWLDFENTGNSSCTFHTGRVLLETGGFRASPYCTSWSYASHTTYCDGYSYDIYQHPLLMVEPGLKLSGWVVFEIPKEYLDRMEDLTLGYADPHEPNRSFLATIKLLDRRPPDLPSLTIASPRDGSSYSRLDAQGRYHPCRGT